MIPRLLPLLPLLLQELILMLTSTTTTNSTTSITSTTYYSYIAGFHHLLLQKIRPNFTPLSFGIFFLKMHRILNTWDSGGIGHIDLTGGQIFVAMVFLSKRCDADVFWTQVTITTDAIIWP